jgi:hypothetical protein
MKKEGRVLWIDLTLEVIPNIFLARKYSINGKNTGGGKFWGKKEEKVSETT